jgi:hypothetical protein
MQNYASHQYDCRYLNGASLLTAKLPIPTDAQGGSFYPLAQIIDIEGNSLGQSFVVPKRFRRKSHANLKSRGG